MKRAIFLSTTVVLIIGSCYFLICNKSDDETSISFSHFNSTDEIIDLPLYEWRENLVGKWESEEIFTSTTNVQQIKGTKYYDAKGNFNNIITYKFFKCNNTVDQNKITKMNPNCLHMILGGSYSGTWYLDSTNKKWVERILVCDIVTGRVDKGYKDPNFCDNYFKPNNELAFGIADDSISRFKIVKFTKAQIITTGHFYNSDKDYLLKLTRMEE